MPEAYETQGSVCLFTSILKKQKLNHHPKTKDGDGRSGDFTAWTGFETTTPYFQLQSHSATKSLEKMCEFSNTPPPLPPASLCIQLFEVTFFLTFFNCSSIEWYKIMSSTGTRLYSTMHNEKSEASGHIDPSIVLMHQAIHE